MEIKSVVKSVAIFSNDKDKKHRYLLKKVWNIEKPIATIIMLNPRSQTDALFLDKSVMLFMNHCISKGFGGLYIVNLFSYRCDSDKGLKAIDYSKRYDKDTDKWIIHAVKNSTKLFIGWGSNKNRKNRIKQFKEILSKCNEIEIVRLDTEDDRKVHMSRLTLKKKEVAIEIDRI